MIANKNFLPQDDQSEFEVNLRAPEGTSLESTEVITNRIANAMRQQMPEVDYTLVTIGGDPAQDAQPRHDLRPPEADRSSGRAISSRSWTTSATRSCRRSPPDLRTSVQPVADDRRRRRAERRRSSSSSTART